MQKLGKWPSYFSYSGGPDLILTPCFLSTAGVPPPSPCKQDTLHYVILFFLVILGVLKGPCGTGDKPRTPGSEGSRAFKINPGTTCFPEHRATNHCWVWLQIKTKGKQRTSFLHVKHLFSLLSALSQPSKIHILKQTNQPTNHFQSNQLTLLRTSYPRFYNSSLRERVK